MWTLDKKKPHVCIFPSRIIRIPSSSASRRKFSPTALINPVVYIFHGTLFTQVLYGLKSFNKCPTPHPIHLFERLFFFCTHVRVEIKSHNVLQSLIQTISFRRKRIPAGRLAGQREQEIQAQIVDMRKVLVGNWLKHMA